MAVILVTSFISLSQPFGLFSIRKYISNNFGKSSLSNCFEKMMSGVSSLKVASNQLDFFVVNLILKLQYFTTEVL